MLREAIKHVHFEVIQCNCSRPNCMDFIYRTEFEGVTRCSSIAEIQRCRAR